MSAARALWGSSSPDDLCLASGGGFHPREMVTVSPFYPPSWFTSQGAWKKGQRLEPRMPNLSDARFITLTMDPARYSGPHEAYEVGKRHMREFLYRLDIALGVDGRTPYAWKLEFHKSGWPHWHLIFLYRSKVCADLLRSLWGKGRIQVDRIRGAGVKYLFKYAAKASDLPEYIATLPRVRIFQASPNFYVSPPGHRTAPPSPRRVDNTQKQLGPGFRSTVGERIERDRGALLLSTPAKNIVLYGADLSYGRLILQVFQGVHDSPPDGECLESTYKLKVKVVRLWKNPFRVPF